MSKLVELGWPNAVILNINFQAMVARESEALEVTRQRIADVSLSVLKAVA